MRERSSVIPQSSQLDRIEAKLDEVLEFRDRLEALLATLGGTKMLKVLARGRIGGV